MGGPHFRPALLVFFLLCDVVCCPLSWSKTSGGLITNWVGFELLLKEHALGLSERRAAWFVSWARKTANSKVVHIRYFEEALGTAVFVASALELIRPFLSPLYAFSCSGSREGARPLPPYVSFFLRFLASSVERGTGTRLCAAEAREESIAPRAWFAQASDDRTGVGGWLPVLGPDGRPDTLSSPWFSEEITEHEFPWVFAKDGKASRVIATLEALALPLALRAFYPSLPSGVRTKIVLVPSITDNRGNGSLLNKLMTNRYPLSALLMEFSEQLRHTGIRPEVRWAPRESNAEADRLANGDSSGFSQSLRVRLLPTAATVVRAQRGTEEGNTELSKVLEIFIRGRDVSGSERRSSASSIHGDRDRFIFVLSSENQRPNHGCRHPLCHGASFLRSYACQVLLSSGVFGFPRPFLPNTLSLLVYHFLIIFLAVAVFGVEQLLSYCGLHRFHDLADTFSTGS